MNLICNDIVKHIYEMSTSTSFTLSDFAKSGNKTGSQAYYNLMVSIFSVLLDAKHIALHTEEDGNSNNRLTYHFTKSAKESFDNIYQYYRELI